MARLDTYLVRRARPFIWLAAASLAWSPFIAWWLR